MRFLFISVLLYCFSQNLSAQVNNTAFERRWQLNDSVSEGLSLDVYNFNFFRNYEYFNDVADGLTYFGLQLSPVLTWQANENLMLYGGAMLAKDFGNDGIQEVKPIIGIKYEKNGISLINGALESTLSHGYIEPILNYDLSITDPVEYGTQLIFDRPFHRTDIWVNWENMIYKPSNEAEKIAGGLSSDINLLKKEGHHLSLPFQALFYHSGGQIDTVDQPIVTFMNLSAGLGYSMKFAGSINRIYTQNHILLFRSQDNTQMPFSSGDALYFNVGADSKWVNLMVSYWKGDGFIAPLGAPVFQSVSSKLGHEGQAFEHRNLLFFRLIKDFTLADQLKVSGRFEPLIDLDSHNFDYSMSLYLVYRGIFD